MPELSLKEKKILTIKDYIRQSIGTLLGLYDNDKIPKQIVDNIISLINKYFPDDPVLKKNNSSAFTIISLATIFWFEKRDRMSLAIILYPKTEK